MNNVNISIIVFGFYKRALCFSYITCVLKIKFYGFEKKIQKINQ